MAQSDRTIFVCSCEDTMPLDTGALAKGCRGSDVHVAKQLCRAEIGRFRAIASGATSLTVACTQETAVFDEVAEEAGRSDPISYANIRETAGWSNQAAAAGPKMAALLAAAVESMPAVRTTTLESEGVVLIYGKDERAVEAGNLLKDHLNVTVLLKDACAIAPPASTVFPVARGNVKTAKGYLGAFELTIDKFALPKPSSRAELVFGPSRNGAQSRCDIVLDLSGGTPLFTAAEFREGYLRADPEDAATVLRMILKARDLVGTFEKPLYINLSEDLCAHARSRIVGCTRCLELCPTGAITPAGNHVAIDAAICAGCGQCAAVCPTGAASYALPPAEALMRKVRTLLSTFRTAGGENPILLIHDEAHGAALISALARFGEGLPARILPLAVNEVTQVGLEAIAAAFAYGASAVRLLVRAKPLHDTAGLNRSIELADRILQGLGFGVDRVAAIETDDPDELRSALDDVPIMSATHRPASFMPTGPKRSALRFALRELHDAAPAPVDIIPLPERAPFGTIEVDAQGCTLCLSCVSACPTGALVDDPDRPLLRFSEGACVQCGLCQATCPEKVITLKPQIDFRAATASAQVIKEEQPFCCIRCGKPFGVRSTIERVAEKLAGKHWMFKVTPGRMELIKMCDDCRVAVVTEQDFDPFGSPPRNPPRTTEDYLREREDAEKAKGDS
jgi:ferredoxin